MTNTISSPDNEPRSLTNLACPLLPDGNLHEKGHRAAPIVVDGREEWGSMMCLMECDDQAWEEKRWHRQDSLLPLRRCHQ